MTDCPPGWANAPLYEICAINPRVDKNSIDTETVVSFVPMPAVEAGTGKIDVSETRSFGVVRKGYTPFRKDDVLFAKITPCMENGKMAIVPDLASEYGFGSTEFHVLRPANGVDPRFIYHAVSNRAFRFHAEHNMTGAVGQKRVPASILEEQFRNPIAANERATPNRRQDRGALRRDRPGSREPSRCQKSHRGSIANLCSSPPSKAASPPTGGQEPRQAGKPGSPACTRIREERETRYSVALE